MDLSSLKTPAPITARTLATTFGRPALGGAAAGRIGRTVILG